MKRDYSFLPRFTTVRSMFMFLKFPLKQKKNFGCAKPQKSENSFNN